MSQSPPSPITTPKKPRRTTFAILLRIAVTVLALTILAGVILVRIQPPYRRYISPTFPDGARYTFLYPARLSVVHEDARYGGDWRPGSKGPHSVLINTDRILRFGHSVGQLSVSDCLAEWADSLLHPRGYTAGDLYTQVHTAAPGKDGHIRDVRSEKRTISGSQWFQAVRIVDSHTSWGVKIFHRGEGPSIPNSTLGFNRDANVIARSLRVIAPGEAVPTGENPDSK